MKWLLGLIFSTLSLAAQAEEAPKTDQRLRVLMLTYNQPTEHDVLQSLLCLEPCTKDNNCPAEFLKYQVDPKQPEIFWNNDFVVVRPLRPASPSEMVERLNGYSPDFISMSGHHSSGFFGSNGDFNLENLQVWNDGENIQSVFGKASLVMLNGCNTEVKSDFMGDPHAYIRHIVEDTDARGEDFNRLMAAVAQISGIQKSYRHIYPNACIMGYQGTSVPGGVPQIYSQYANVLRGLHKISTGNEIKPRISMLTGNYADNEQKVFSECPGKSWPCNLCEKDSKYYNSLGQALKQYLRTERTRLSENRAFSQIEVDKLESSFKETGFYPNSKWACSTFRPDTVPVMPDARNLPKNGKLLLELLFMPPSERFSGYQYAQLRNELLHQLALMRMNPEELKTLRKMILEPQYKQKFIALQSTGLDHSGLRDYYALGIKLQCRDCLPGFSKDGIWFGEQPIERRMAFAESLQPEFGDFYYKTVMADRDPKVRMKGASKFGPGVSEDIIMKALSDTQEIARAAASTFSWDMKLSNKLRLAAMKSPYVEVRQRVSYVHSGSEIVSNEVMLYALTGPHKDEFESYFGYINKRSSDEVMLAALNYKGKPESIMVTEQINRQDLYRWTSVPYYIRSYHGDKVFARGLEFTGEAVQIAIDMAEKLSSHRSVAVFKQALNHSDLYVRAAAARRLGEKTEPELFAKAFNDTSQKVRWAAAHQLRPELTAEIYRMALAPTQSVHTRQIAARQLYPTIDSSIKELALNDPDSEVKAAARKALGMEK